MNDASPGAGSGSGPAPGVLWLVRHGETEWSRQGRHTGGTDVPLTDHGMRQATALATVFAARRFALVLSSPLQRALETARLAGLLDAEGVEVDITSDLVEWDYGEYEGLTTPEIRRNRPGWTIWSADPPGGESSSAVAQRVDRILARITAALPAGDVMTVCHGHVGRVLAARWLGLPARAGALLALAPGAPCVLGTERETRVIRRWNLPNPLTNNMD